MSKRYENKRKWYFVIAIVIVVVAAVVAFVLLQRSSDTRLTQSKSSTSSMPTQTSSSTSGNMNMSMKAVNQTPVPMKFVRNGNNVHIDMYTEETTVTVADGVTFHAWTFDGTVPGPVIQLQQGDHVTLTLHNLDKTMAHSIDLHAALIAPSANFVDVAPGQSRTIHFTASVPGVYMYHCASQPMILHIGMGMYGMVVVTPTNQAPPTYTIVQSEIYGNETASGTDPNILQEMMNDAPHYVVFNGKAFQYMESPLHATVGKPITIAFVNAGPNNFSAFHIVGTLLQDAQASGDPRNNLYDVQTDTVPPGGGALFTVTFNQPGEYHFLTHAANDASKGAMGTIVVS